MSLLDDFYGDRFRWWVGVVKDVGYDRARCRVRIFGVHTAEDETRLSNELLPWALVLYPTTGSQMSSGNISHDLKPGAWVMGFFMDGTDSQQPVIIGVISGGENSSSSSVDRSSANPGQPTNGQNVPAGQVSTRFNTPSAIAGKNNAEKIYNFFYERLLTIQSRISGDIHIMASTIAGNIQAESSFNPEAYNTGEQAYGLCQWRHLNGGGRWAKMCKRYDLPPLSRNISLDQQVNWAWEELMAGVQNKLALNYLLTAKTIEDAAIGMCYFEYNGSIKGGRWIGPQAPEYQRIVSASKGIAGTFKYSGGSTSQTPSYGATS